MNKKRSLFWGALVGAVICLVVSIYYIIPGYDHVLVTHDSTYTHPTHAFAFFALAVICGLVALVTRPKSAKGAEQERGE
jgi:hypothetical protein